MKKNPQREENHPDKERKTDLKWEHKVHFEEEKQVSFEKFAEACSRMLEVVRTLRLPGGCPWDRKQTLRSLRSSVIEEAYEVAEAIDELDESFERSGFEVSADEFRKAVENLKEELGDMYFLLTMLLFISSQFGLFEPEEVINSAVNKMITRHPHVFGEDSVKDAEEVLKKWEQRKASEKKRDSLMDGVVTSLPGVQLAYKVQERAARVGFDWDNPEGVIQKIEEEIKEFKDSPTEEELGDIFFSLINLSRKLGYDPESVIARSAKKFMERFRKMEKILKESGKDIHSSSIDEMEEAWQKAKEV